MANDPPKAKGRDAKAARDVRLAEALRANLRKRKSQATARRDGATAALSAPGDERDEKVSST